MNTIRIKDLIVTILPNDSNIAGCDAGVSACPGGCSNSASKFCEGGSKDIGDPADMIVDPAELLEMKELLQHVIHNIDNAINKTKQSQLSNTEAELLERKLNSALSSLKARKK